MRRQSPRMVMLGDTSVGKTSLVNRLMSDCFDSTTQPTTAAAFYHFKATSPDAQSMQIWDTAGMEQFKSLNSLYYRNAVGAILVFDVTNRKTFESLPNWHHDFLTNSAPDPVVYVAANKCDDTEHIEITEAELKRWCESNKAKGFLTSAVSGQNVRSMFEEMSKEIPASRQSTAANEVLQISEAEEPQGRKCC